MATPQQQIAERFLAKLAESKDVDAGKIEQLKKLPADAKKLKADDFVKAFSAMRKVSEPNKPKSVPADPDVLDALAEIADHPEITLSGREILRCWSLTSLQQRLLKTGGRLVRHARYFTLQLAESYLIRPLFPQIVARTETRRNGELRGPNRN